MDIQNTLFTLKDEKYGDFSSKLTPNIPREKFIGVRSPDIKALAKEIRNHEKVEQVFLERLPHKYVEEYLLHVHLINKL